MSASKLVEQLTERQLKQARFMRDPRFLLPSVIAGPAIGFAGYKKLTEDPRTPGERVEGLIRQHPVTTGAVAGGTLAALAGAMLAHRLYRQHQDKIKQLESAADTKPAIPEGLPIQINIGQPEASAEKVAMWAGLGNIARGIGQVGRAGATEGARGLGEGLSGVGRMTRWAGGQLRKSLGFHQLDAEQAALARIAKNKKLQRSLDLLDKHMRTRQIRPHTGLGGWLLSPGDAVGRHFTRGGRLNWMMDQLRDPAQMRAILDKAPPQVRQAVQALQGARMGGRNAPLLSEHLARNQGGGLLLPAVVGGAVAAPFVGAALQKPELPIAEPGTPGSKPSLFQPVADAVGGTVGKYVSPTVGSWIQNNPALSTLGGAAGLGGLGYMGYRMWNGGRDS